MVGILFFLTLLQKRYLQVMWKQSRMVPLVSESPGGHPVMPLATGYPTLGEEVWVVEVKISIPVLPVGN